MRFKIDWASLIFTFSALFSFVFEGNCQVKATGRLIFGGAI